MTAYPHMCRDGHEEIGHRNSEREQCAVCVLLNVVDDLANDAAAAAERMDMEGLTVAGSYLRLCVQQARSLASEVKR